jgi:hypothetical protein
MVSQEVEVEIVAAWAEPLIILMNVQVAVDSAVEVYREMAHDPEVDRENHP